MARRDHVQFPWEREVWATDEFHASRDRALYATVIQALRGSPSLHGVRQNRVFVNPYLSTVPMTVALGVGIILWWIRSGSGWSIAFVVGLDVGAVLLVRICWMIPGWHRARAAARVYAQARGIPFPPELR